MTEFIKVKELNSPWLIHPPAQTWARSDPPPLFATALSPLYPVLPLAHNIVTHVVIVLLKDGIIVKLCC